MTRKIVISLVLVFILSFGPLPRPSAGKASTDLQAGFFSAGDLDPEFGEAGELIFPNVTEANKNGLAIQPDGKLLLAVNMGDTTPGSAVLRFLSDGSLDSSFGSDGRVETGFGALFLQPDGKILVVGDGMERYLPDGNPDPSFGEGGRVDGIGGSAAGLQPDGKILVGGIAVNDADNTAGVFVARISPDGGLDSSFDQDGLAQDLFISSFDELTLSVTDLAVLPDGKIVVVGSAGNEDHSGWIIRRFNSDGSFNAGLGTPDHGPCINFRCFEEAQAVVVQPDGKFLVAGGRDKVPGEGGVDSFYLLRFNPDGSLDESFGQSGEVYTNFPSSVSDVAYDIALQEDGKIIAAGTAVGDFALARYQPDGSLDDGFGDDGLVTTDFGGGELAIAVALQPDGKIVAAGNRVYRIAGGDDFEWSLAVARYYAITTIPTFPATPILDNFNRANGRLSSNWKGSGGAYRIVGNQVDVRGDGPIYWKHASGVNQEVYVSLSTVDPAGWEQDLLLKVQGDYGPNWGEGAIEVLYDATADTVTVWTFRLDTLDWFSYPDIPVTFADGDQFGARALATGEVVIFKNGMEVGRVTLNSADQAFFNLRGGHIGLWFIDARKAFFDDFGGGDIVLP